MHEAVEAELQHTPKTVNLQDIMEATSPNHAYFQALTML